MLLLMFVPNHNSLYVHNPGSPTAAHPTSEGQGAGCLNSADSSDGVGDGFYGDEKGDSKLHFIPINLHDLAAVLINQRLKVL